MVLTDHYGYQAFGLTFRSEIALPELPPQMTHGEDVDLTVALEPLPPAPTRYGPPGTLYPVGDEMHRIDVDTVGSYLIRGKNHIAVDPLPGAASETVRLFLLGSALGAILHQRDGLALHASTVEIDGRAVLLMGESGVGKSTTAAALTQRGHRLVADDVTYLTPTTAGMAVHQGVQRIKLWQQSAQALGIDPSSLTGVHPDFPSRRSMATRNLPLPPIPLGAVILLSPEAGSSVALERLVGVQALSTLLQNTYRPYFVERLSRGAAHLAKIATLARQAAVYKLHRPTDRMSVAEVVSTVLRHTENRRAKEIQN